MKENIPKLTNEFDPKGEDVECYLVGEYQELLDEETTTKDAIEMAEES